MLCYHEVFLLFIHGCNWLVDIVTNHTTCWSAGFNSSSVTQAFSIDHNMVYRCDLAYLCCNKLEALQLVEYVQRVNVFIGVFKFI